MSTAAGRRYRITAALLLLAAGGAVARLWLWPPATRGETITILSYNVQNLFDAERDGTEYRGYDPARGAWDAQIVAAKAGRLARVIRRAPRGGPDVLCLQEVENRRVLELLATQHLEGMGYRAGAVTETAGSPVQVGLLSRLPVEAVRVHAPVSGWPPARREENPAGVLRSVLEVRLSADGRRLHLFVNHWKSRAGGAAQTAPARRAAARVVARRIRALQAADPGAEIVVCGDLNTEPDTFTRTGGAYPTALMPLEAADGGPHALLVSPDAAAVRAATRQAPAAVGAPPAGRGPVLFSPWGLTEAPGSYVYRERWERIDHTLVSAGLLDASGLRVSAFDVVRPPFATEQSGYPKASPRPARGRPASIGGYSDHFPVLLTLTRAGAATTPRDR